MAVAHFQFHAPGGFWPVLNGGIPAALYCFVWLCFWAAGAGPWSLDAPGKGETAAGLRGMPVALESFSPVSRTFPTGFKEPMAETYYCPHDLPRFAEMGKDRPELWTKFLDYYNAVFADGALTAREKSLIALGVAHAVQCPYCIDAYTQAALQNGSDREQMTEAVHVACAIRGGASLVHGVQMRNVADKVGM